MADTTEARRLADELAADVAALLREGLPQEALRAEAAQGMLRDLGDAIESRDATIAELRAQVEALRADAERYRFIRHPYISTGQHKQIMCAVDELSEHLMDQAIDAARSQESAR